ncbi:hypothetical protein [Bradyrhizobium sp. USDA 3364]
MIEQYLPLVRGTVMLGIKSEAPRAVTLGCYFLLKIEMIRLDRPPCPGIDLPIDRILTEADGPSLRLTDTSASLPV